METESLARAELCRPKKPFRAKITGRGVNLIDTDNTPLLGITDQDAVELHKSLSSLLTRIKSRLPKPRK